MPYDQKPNFCKNAMILYETLQKWHLFEGCTLEVRIDHVEIAMAIQCQKCHLLNFAMSSSENYHATN